MTKNVNDLALVFLNTGLEIYDEKKERTKCNICGA